MSIRHVQRGQTLPVVLAVLATALAAIILSYNSGQEMVAKSRVVNAADAAAYSGGTWVARRLNFIAYTNRAMVGNHVAVGHLITFVSWIRYLDDAATKLHDIGQFIPYVAQATASAKKAAKLYRYVAELTAQFYVPAADSVNRLYELAQVEARADLAPQRLDSIMQAVVAKHDNHMRVNDYDEINDIPNPFNVAAITALETGNIGLMTAVQRYDTSTDDGRIASLVDLTLQSENDLARWMTGDPRYQPEPSNLADNLSSTNAFSTLPPKANWESGQRGWDIELPFLVRLRKQGVTGHSTDANGFKWEANDRFQVSRWSVSKWDWKGWDTLAHGAATSNEFYNNYSGIHGYHNLGYDDHNQRGYPVVAVVTLAHDAVPARDNFSIQVGKTPISYASAAQVEYTPPKACSWTSGPDCLSFTGDKNDEYSNLFNPFWQARLLESPLSP